MSLFVELLRIVVLGQLDGAVAVVRDRVANTEHRAIFADYLSGHGSAKLDLGQDRGQHEWSQVHIEFDFMEKGREHHRVKVLVES